jgi:diaminopropionate ammonia-lyase
LSPDARWFHRRLPGYAPTPLVEAPALAERYGLERLWVKDETNRFGLPSFKALGASWAGYQLLARRVPEVGSWATIEELRARLAAIGHFTFVSGSQGNHGRALAWFAAQLHQSARIYLPRGVAREVEEEIAGGGAETVVVDGDYDHAVGAAAASAGANDVLVSDVARSEGDLGPSLVIDGYRTLLAEIDEQLRDAGAEVHDVVVVPIGVGSLAAAAVVQSAGRTKVLGVEPADAACVAASLEAGAPVSVAVPTVSATPGLNCPTPSITAWPMLVTGLDSVATVDAEATEAAVRDLLTVGVNASRTGAAALAGLASVAPCAGGSAVVLVTERGAQQ